MLPNVGHLSESELQGRLSQAAGHLKPGNKYVHYRMPDQPYEILAIGFLEENEEPAVVYKALYGERLVWVRKLSNFCEEIEYEGKKTPRFQKVE